MHSSMIPLASAELATLEGGFFGISIGAQLGFLYTVAERWISDAVEEIVDAVLETY